MLELLAKLLKVLNAEVAPWQISLGFVLGMMMGLTPLWSLSNLLLLFLLLVIRINLSAFLLAFGLFSGIAYLFDPLMEQLGTSLLHSEGLKVFWTTLYQSDFWRLTHFNHTLTLGSTLSGLALALPLFLLSNFLIRNYRQHILAWVRKSKLMQMLKANRFYGIYKRVSGGELS